MRQTIIYLNICFLKFYLFTKNRVLHLAQWSFLPQYVQVSARPTSVAFIQPEFCFLPLLLQLFVFPSPSWVGALDLFPSQFFMQAIVHSSSVRRQWVLLSWEGVGLFRCMMTRWWPTTYLIDRLLRSGSVSIEITTCSSFLGMTCSSFFITSLSVTLSLRMYS
jgi:hypothetical protein